MSRSEFVFNDIMGTPPALARQMGKEMARTARPLRSLVRPRRGLALTAGATLAGALLVALLRGRQARST